LSSLFDHFRAGRDENEHGSSLFFNRTLMGTVPYRGQQWPSLKTEEFDELETRADAKIKTFNLGDETQLEEYQLVLHRIVNGWYTRLAQSHHWDNEKKVMYVHLEWCQLYKEAPPHLEGVINSEGEERYAS
jgi:hypothetical protein